MSDMIADADYFLSVTTDEFNNTFDVCRQVSIVPPAVAQLTAADFSADEFMNGRNQILHEDD